MKSIAQFTENAVLDKSEKTLQCESSKNPDPIAGGGCLCLVKSIAQFTENAVLDKSDANWDGPRNK